MTERTAAADRPAAGADPANAGTEDVRALLADPKLLAHLPGDFGDDTQLALDSLGLVWLLHLIENRYGLVLTASEELLTEFDSVRGITEGLRRAAREGVGDA
ncbi:MAG TPA: hypothetical protein VGX23_04835 [Actinocrinis sp.]|nr:hypothetical protein [Actinocrinis sp.]